MKSNTVLSRKISVAVAMAAVVAFSVPVTAATFETEVVVRGLTRPTGIAARGSGTLYVTQLPTPGISGRNGGSNLVSEIKLASGKINAITIGEPEPTNLALSKSGELYWTCKSAGVILERNQQGEVGLLLRNLSKPSGIALDHNGFVYFTQIPTPGVRGADGGSNSVSVTDGVDVELLNMGQPEPSDISVARDGTAFWTCKTAGVVVMRMTDGTIQVLQRGLNKPMGIALDEVRARLYFTEVPTPGVSGRNGGSNSVSYIDLESGALELVDAGDPEPTDITVAENGNVYWTCSSAGVIVEAKEVK